MKITSHSNSDLTVSQKTKNFNDEPENVKDITRETLAPQSKKSKIFRRKSKDFRLPNRKPLSSQQSIIKRNNRLDKKARSYSTKTSMLDKSATTIMKRRVLNSLRPSNNQSKSS